VIEHQDINEVGTLCQWNRLSLLIRNACMRVLHIAFEREAAGPSSQARSPHRTHLECSVGSQTADPLVGIFTE
jgi:hypothetical protein